MRSVLTLVVLVATLLGATGCGDDTSDSSPDSDSKSTKVIDVTFDGTSVTPNGDRVDVEVGQPVEFVVKADAEGEIHVHSTPEQELNYGAGTTTLMTTFDKPGVVEVESHALDKTIVQLEVK